jgi:hypothetical protein
MIEQQKVNRARLLGYALGAIGFVAVVAWKFVTR